MIYCIITNRPAFLKFALAQSEKCSNKTVVVLANGPAFRKQNPGLNFHYFYKESWRFNADAFNWFRANFQKDDHLFLMDDDIYLKGDSTREAQQWIEKGFDRVVYTRSYLFDLQAGETAVTNWPARKVGGAWAMSRDIWRLSPWPEWPVDPMLRFFNDLPEHNVKKIGVPKITHLLHGENIILKRSIHQNFDIANDPKLINEILKFNIKFNQE